MKKEDTFWVTQYVGNKRASYNMSGSIRDKIYYNFDELTKVSHINSSILKE